MSFALAPGEVPLGIKNPLLSPPPLGQMMMQPKFMKPLGTRSLMGLDHSLLSSELEPGFYTDPSIPFQDSPFFESPKPPQPEPQIRRRSIELALDPIDRSEKVSPESSVASIPEAFTEETLESIDESPSEVQSSSELSSEVVPEPAIQRKAFIPEFVEPFSRSESLVQRSRIQPVLDPPTPLGKAGPETGGVRVFEEEAKPIVNVPVIEGDLGGSESSGIMNELNIEPESLEFIPETTPIAHSQAIQLNSIQTAEQSASELQTDVLPITTNLDPPSPLEKGGPELGVGLESELPELQPKSESDAELESDAKLEVEPKSEPELLKSDPTIKVPLTKGDLGGSGSISITSQSEVTDQSSVQLDSLKEISDETIQAQFIETPIAPEITPEVIPEVTPEASSQVTSEASLEQQPATRSAIQFDPEVIHSEILSSESLSQPNNVLEETAIDAIQPRLAEPITSLESRIYQAHIDTQIDTIAPVIIQPKQDNTVTSIVNNLAINDPIPQEIVQQSKTQNLVENSNTLEAPIANDLAINDAIPQEVVQQSKTQNLVENSNILEAPIANDLAINDAIPQEAVQQTKTENLVENSNILEAPIINKSTIVNESISSPESLQIKSPQTQATPNVTDKPQNELPSSSSSFPELPRAIQSLSVLEPITQLKPISSLTIDNPILNQPNPQTEATTSRVEESPVIQPFSNPDIQQTPQFSEQPINRKVENSSIRSNPKINPVSDSATIPKISSESDTSWSSIAELLQAPIETRTTPQPVSQSTSQSIQTSTETYPEPSFEINQTEAGQTENLQTDRYPDQGLTNYTDGYTDGYSNLNLYPEANSPPIEPRIQRELAETTSESKSAAIPNHPETNKDQGSHPAAKASPEQLEQLAQEIYRLMRQRLALDRERRGNLYSGRLF